MKKRNDAEGRSIRPHPAFFVTVVLAAVAVSAAVAPGLAVRSPEAGNGPFPPALPAEAESWEDAIEKIEPQALRYILIPENPTPGEPVTIAVHGVPANSLAFAVLMSGDRRLGRATFFRVAGRAGGTEVLATILTVPATVSQSRLSVNLTGPAGILAEIPLELAEREFLSETIRLNPQLTGIITDASPERTAESEHLWAVLNRVGEEAFHFDAFIPPVESTRRTSHFGSRRVFVNADGRRSTSIHAGVDIGVPTGTEVHASGAGRVVMARERIISGNTVMVEHLPGIYSLYYHLDSIAVKEGQTVARGAVVGLSGSTGLSTGPHLHWEVRVFGENTDPDAFLARPLIDREAILGMLEEGN